MTTTEVRGCSRAAAKRGFQFVCGLRARDPCAQAGGVGCEIHAASTSPSYFSPRR